MTTMTSDARSGSKSVAPGGAGAEASPEQVRRWLDAGEAVLVDVREADEHARERIAGARLLPLSRFDPDHAAGHAKAGQRLVLHCKSGRRSADAARLAAPAARSGVAVVSMAGGLDAWKRAGLPTEAGAGGCPLSVLRQVQIVVGAGVLVGCALAWFVHPGFIALPAFFGAGLLFAGASGTCAMASLLGMAPWNRLPACEAPPGAGRA